MYVLHYYLILIGAIFSKEIREEDNIWLYCFAQNTMMPTGGQLLNSKTVSHLRHVTVHEQGKSDYWLDK